MVRGRKNPAFLGLVSRLKRLRKAAGMSYDSVAAATGMLDAPTVFRLEHGQRIPRLDTVEKVATALAVSPSYLAYGVHATAPVGCESSGASYMGQRLRSAREALGLSILAIAKHAGISHTSVGNIERGAMPNIEAAERLAVALGVSPAWLAFGAEPVNARRLPPRRSTDSLSPSSD